MKVINCLVALREQFRSQIGVAKSLAELGKGIAIPIQTISSETIAQYPGVIKEQNNLTRVRGRNPEV
jgi:hypothetical protein